ncbi:MAG: keto-deoxy-phosphogluconate aldolase, partial [Tabrizicola sp.]|nr:keto-deoxy-phosphogluconate aldolase [Tabrizicola sp.]
RSRGLPFLPGCSTASEAMTLASDGFEVVKLFPAEAVGGLSFLRSLASPLPDVWFCPTGGIGAANVSDYLSLPNVLCVGGSWMVRPESVAARDWKEIDRQARLAAALR